MKQFLVCEILVSKICYFFGEIKVSEVVIVIYKFRRIIVCLVIYLDGKFIWFIYYNLGFNFDNLFIFFRMFELSLFIVCGDFYMSVNGVYNIKWLFWILDRINIIVFFERDFSIVVCIFILYKLEGLLYFVEVQFVIVRDKVLGIYVYVFECGIVGNELYVSLFEFYQIELIFIFC